VFANKELERILEDLQNVDRDKDRPHPEEPALQYLYEEFGALAILDVRQNLNVLQDDIAINIPGEIPFIRLPPIVFDDILCSLTQSLNFKQRQYCAHVMDNTSPIYEYVGGGAGWEQAD